MTEFASGLSVGSSGLSAVLAPLLNVSVGWAQQRLDREAPFCVQALIVRDDIDHL